MQHLVWAGQLVELGHKVPAVERWALGPDQSHSWKFEIRRPKVSRNPKPTLVDIGAQAGRPVFRLKLGETMCCGRRQPRQEAVVLGRWARLLCKVKRRIRVKRIWAHLGQWLNECKRRGQGLA